MGRSSKFRQRIILADMPVRPVRQPSSRTLVLTSAMGPEMTPYPAPFSDAVRPIRPPGSCASPRVTRENSRRRPFQTPTFLKQVVQLCRCHRRSGADQIAGDALLLNRRTEAIWWAKPNLLWEGWHLPICSRSSSVSATRLSRGGRARNYSLWP
jgi:hypothetical protein